MRRITIGVAGALLVASLAAPAAATQPTSPDVVGNGHLVTICHATSSNNPGQLLARRSRWISPAAVVCRRSWGTGSTRRASPTTVAAPTSSPAFTYDGAGYGGYGDHQPELARLLRGREFLFLSRGARHSRAPRGAARTTGRRSSIPDVGRGARGTGGTGVAGIMVTPADTRPSHPASLGRRDSMLDRPGAPTPVASGSLEEQHLDRQRPIRRPAAGGQYHPRPSPSTACSRPTAATRARRWAPRP